MTNYIRLSLTTIFIAGFLWSPSVFSSWFRDTLIDPEDGMLDASDYLASASGFLPVPIIITEPAVGYGLAILNKHLGTKR